MLDKFIMLVALGAPLVYSMYLNFKHERQLKALKAFLLDHRARLVDGLSDHMTKNVLNENDPFVRSSFEYIDRTGMDRDSFYRDVKEAAERKSGH